MKMSGSDRFVEIRVLTDKEPIKIAVQEVTVVEDVCTQVAKILGIGPICRHLFSLRLQDKSIWLYPNCRLQELKSDCIFNYRIRFKVPKTSRLKQMDMEAFNYYYHQVRRDVIDNNVPDLNIEKHKGELLGLGVTDMYRVMIDEGVPLDQVEADYKKYIPKALLKNHFLFIKPKIHSSLSKIKIRKEQNGWFVKEEYLNMFDKIAPRYLSENYIAQIDDKGFVRLAFVQVNPFHEEQPGVRYRYDAKEEWQHLCTIDDLCYISVRKDGTVELCRKNGIPSYFKFNSTLIMYSFVSLLDGYYRLICKWNFNLCMDVFTPSLKILHSLKCHGPVGGQFSYGKLEEKRNNKPGTFILREGEKNHDVYYLDVCTRESAKPKTYKIEKLHTGDYLFSYDGQHYSSIPALITSYRKPNNSLELLECLPPSEFDKSRLLMCAQEDLKMDKNNVINPDDYFLTTSPQIINVKHLQVFRGIKKESRSGIMDHYRCIFKHPKDGKVEASMKILKPEYRDMFLKVSFPYEPGVKELLELVGSWATLQSNSVVKLFGVTLKEPVAMVTEYLHLGPFDAYLRENKLMEVDLVEAGTYLASALWHLEECGIVHGSIRCRKLLVSAHNENTCLVKLCDPGLHKYTNDDLPWIPPECYGDFKLAKLLSTADVWAFGTTLWEIFSFGATPNFPDCDKKEFYLGRKRLPIPDKCPIEIYKLILECWDCDSYKRKKPQAIMRDINRILYQVFNSRRTHSYATAFPKAFDHESTTESNTSLWSGKTADTLLDPDLPMEDLIPVSDFQSNFNTRKMFAKGNFIVRGSDDAYSISTLSSGLSAILNEPETRSSSPWDTNPNFQTIFELDKDCNVILQGKIGQGFYGEVFKGYLERPDREPQLVAVKKLKANALSTTRQDLEREISIMENLKHRNIVAVIGAFQEPDISLVMEFVQHGSLQTYLKINKETLKTETLLQFALDVACGMDYLVEKNIVHRDLAARNILVASENHVKISDFGLARVVGQNNYYILETSRELPIKWYAPESLKDGRFSHLSDVWSYGVTLFEMFSLGEDPKLQCCANDMDQSQLLAALEGGAHLPCPPTCPQVIYVELILPCWKLESSERPAFSKICDTICRIRQSKG